MLQLWAVRATSASRASLLLGTEPLFAVAVSVVIGHESMTILGLVGGVLIVVATYAAQGMEIRHREAAHPLAASSPPTLA
jgi:drug/metabolite transporter (DMT)-like permease